jgi:hypothetical protein
MGQNDTKMTENGRETTEKSECRHIRRRFRFFFFDFYIYFAIFYYKTLKNAPFSLIFSPKKAREAEEMIQKAETTLYLSRLAMGETETAAARGFRCVFYI